MNPVLSIQNLSKSYGSVSAVNELSFEVDQGNIFGILGPNGSGKTTTLATVLGIIPTYSGNFQWFGERARSEHRKRIGALIETPNFYPYLSGIDNLKIKAAIKGCALNENKIVELSGIGSRAKSKVSTYSLGMKQRLAFAATLIGDPEVLILDEPTNGLDPQGIAEVRELIVELGQRGKTIIMASHLLDEVQKVCKEVVILNQGKAVAQGRVNRLLNNERRLVLQAEDTDFLASVAEGFEGTLRVSGKENEVILSVKDDVDTADLNRYFFERGVVLTQLYELKDSLESEYFQIIRDASH